MDKIGWEGVKAELAERGFGCAVGERCEWTVGLLSAGVSRLVLERAADLLPGLEEHVIDGLAATTESLERLRQDAAQAGEDGLAQESFSWALDPTIVRGMGYYTGQIFEVEHPEVNGLGGGRWPLRRARRALPRQRGTGVWYLDRLRPGRRPGGLSRRPTSVWRFSTREMPHRRRTYWQRPASCVPATGPLPSCPAVARCACS